MKKLHDICLFNLSEFSCRPSMEMFQIKIRFLYRDRFGKKKLILNFDINMKEQLIKSNVFEVLKVLMFNLKIIIFFLFICTKLC